MQCLSFDDPLPWASLSHVNNIAIDICNIAYRTPLLSNDIPRSFKEAISPSNVNIWVSAVENEQSSITQNNTLSYVELAADMDVLPCTYAFTLRNSHPIVAKGWPQVHGVDCGETHAPVFKFASIRVMLAAVLADRRD